MAKQNFKEVSSQAGHIIDSLKKGSYSGIYLLMGEDSYYIDIIAGYIAANALTDQEREFNQVILYGKDTDGAAIVSQARRYPMMSSRQVVIVREAQAMTNFEMLSHYFENPLSSTVLVICYKGKSLEKRSAIYKSAVKSAVILDTVTPRDYEISNWIVELVKGKGVAIEPKAVQMITDHIGADLVKISSELDKLLTLLDQGTQTITAKHIHDNIGINKDYNNFELTKALSERNFYKALLISDYFAANPKDNPIQVTLSVLFNHFQRIVTYNIYKWECKGRGIPIGSEYEIAKLLKLQSAFFVSEYIQASNNYPAGNASAILSLIREWDMKSKGMNLGSGGEQTLLMELILRISAL